MQTSDPLSFHDVKQKLILARTVSLGMMFVLAGVTFGFGLVVYYALDGIPLMGNFVTVWGEPLFAIIAAGGLPIVIILALVFGAKKRSQVFEMILKEHPETITEETDAEKIIAAFTAGRFMEFGILWGYGLASAILFHLLVSAVLPGVIVVLLLTMLMRFPYSFLARRWYASAVVLLERRRTERTKAGAA